MTKTGPADSLSTTRSGWSTKMLRDAWNANWSLRHRMSCELNCYRWRTRNSRLRTNGCKRLTSGSSKSRQSICRGSHATRRRMNRLRRVGLVASIALNNLGRGTISRGRIDHKVSVSNRTRHSIKEIPIAMKMMRVSTVTKKRMRTPWCPVDWTLSRWSTLYNRWNRSLTTCHREAVTAIKDLTRWGCVTD